MYEINTLEQLIDTIIKLSKEDTSIYTIREIVDDGFTMGIINPKLKAQIMLSVGEE